MAFRSIFLTVWKICQFNVAGSVFPYRKNWTIFFHAVGSCERIVTSPLSWAPDQEAPMLPAPNFTWNREVFWLRWTRFFDMGHIRWSFLSDLCLPRQIQFQMSKQLRFISHSVPLPNRKTYFHFPKSLEKKISPQVLFKPIIKTTLWDICNFKKKCYSCIRLLVNDVLILGAGVGEVKRAIAESLFWRCFSLGIGQWAF